MVINVKYVHHLHTYTLPIAVAIKRVIVVVNLDITAVQSHAVDKTKNLIKDTHAKSQYKVSFKVKGRHFIY